MHIIIKYIIRSSLEKVSKVLLIIFAIAISGALFYTSSAVKENAEITYIDKIVQSVGDTDIVITTNSDSPTKYVPDQIIQKLNDEIQYSINRIDVLADYVISRKKNNTINVVGMDLSDYQKINDLILLEQKDLKPFVGNKIVISKSTAEYYNIQLGEDMKIIINGTTRKFKVVGIAVEKGIFLNEMSMRQGLTPYKKLSEYIESNKLPTGIYVKAKEEGQVQILIQRLQELYPKYEVKQTFTQEDIDKDIAMLSLSLVLITFIVSFMSMFIIYSSFKIVLMQKLPHLGTFRSIGADKKIINKVMFLESTIYGILGGIVGCILGVIITYGISYVTMPAELKAVGIKVPLKISFEKVIFGFIMSNVICFASTAIPILNMSKKSIKEIIFNITTHIKKKKNNLGVGCVSLIVAAIIPSIAPYKLAAPLAILALTLVAVGIVCIIEPAIQIITNIIKPFTILLFGNIGSLAIKNIRKDKSLINCACLIMIGVSVLLMVNTMTINLTSELIDQVANLETYDIKMVVSKLEKNDLTKIRTYGQVKDVIGISSVQNVDVTNCDFTIGQIDGIEVETFFDYRAINVLDKTPELINKLQNGRNIVVSKAIMDRHELKIGDELEIDFEPYGGKKRMYTIVGKADTCMEKGNYAMVGTRYLQLDTANYNYSSAHIHVKENEDIYEVKSKLETDFKNRSTFVQTIEEFKMIGKETMKEITSLISAFAVIAVVIGCIGIINNFVISFIERKHSIAVFRSIGMSQVQTIKMLLVEAWLVGIIGAIVGILGGSLFFNVSPLFMTVGNVSMTLHHYPKYFIIYIIGGSVLSSIASIIPAKDVLKMNIVDEIKCE